MQPQVLLESGIDAIEMFNGGAFTPGSNWLTAQRFSQCGVTQVGNSDAHLPESIGSGLTRFRGNTADNLHQSLVRGWTAVEGRPWPLTTYFKLLRSAIRRKPNAPSPVRLRSTPPTPP
ncbi:MAG: hypothetical protein HUU31_24575 [Anaerolineae bacterium]|nr:hypothetical protein [Anaerolineae bacterium]